MKIQLLSDLHLSFGGFKKINKDADVIVIAGDNGEGTIARNMLEYMLKLGKKIVMISGNHEYYGCGKFKGKSMEFIDDYWGNLHKELGNNFHYLNNSTCIIDGQRFIGSTLWGYIPPHLEVEITDPYNGLNDFNAIRINGERLTAKMYNELNKKAIDFLTRELKEDDFLITHNAPCSLSVSMHYQANTWNCCYVSDITDLIIDRKPKIAVHGHVHNSSAYMMGSTPILANPRGYVGHAGFNNEFDAKFVFDLDDIHASIDINMEYQSASKKQEGTIPKSDSLGASV